jgi:hypothetical protein
MASSSETLERKALAFRILEEAVATLKLQADPRAPLDTLSIDFKLFHNVVLTVLADLVDMVGGDSDCIPVPDFLADDIDNAFILAQRREEAAEPAINLRRQYGTYSAIGGRVA